MLTYTDILEMSGNIFLGLFPCCALRQQMNTRHF